MVRKLILRIQMNDNEPQSESDVDSEGSDGSEAVEDILDGFKAEIADLLPAIDGVQSQIESITKRIEGKRADPFHVPNRIMTAGAETWCKKYGVEETPSVKEFLWTLLKKSATSTDMQKRTLRLSVADATLLGFESNVMTIFDVMRRIPDLLTPIGS